MREQLIQYVKLLFAGTPDSEDMQQEILQNTLDRYDDLIDQGKTPAAAYRLAISGIGDINEVLGTAPSTAPAPRVIPEDRSKPTSRERPLWKKILLAVAVFLYIISVIPLFVLSEMGMETIGLCGTISICAVAAVANIIASGGSHGKNEDKTDKNAPMTPKQELRKAIKNVISTVGLVLYFVISFASGAWHITWLIFPIMAAVQGIVTASMDLKEGKQNER